VQLAISPMRPDELGFVCNSWKESAKDAELSQLNNLRGRAGQPLIALGTDEHREFCRDFYARYNKRVASVMDATRIVLVARDVERPSLAYGWACAIPASDLFALAYVYTKQRFRHRGIMTELLEQTLAHVPEGLPTAYCAESRFDPIFEGYGMQFAELSDVLEQVRAA
jgi:hypothetical protein